MTTHAPASDLRRVLAAATRERRALLNFTQAELASAADIARITVQRVESGKCTTDLDTLERLARALRVTPDSLLRRAPSAKRAA